MAVAETSREIDTEPSRLFIGGEWRDPRSRSDLPVINPATEQQIGTIAAADEEDVDIAAEVAQKASREWGAWSWERRADALRALGARLGEAVDELARLDALDSGNPITSMRADVKNAIRDTNYYLGLAPQIAGNVVPAGSTKLCTTEREPYGVVGRIIPFNHPLRFAVSKSVPALIAGNSVILKPSEHTSLSALRFAELSEGILPAGVLNVLTGGGVAGASIAKHPLIERVAFTGSARHGADVLREAAPAIKHVTLELGGKNPMIVLADADPARAAKAAAGAANITRSCGQSCGSMSRIFVHRSIVEQFTAELVQQYRAMRIGDPLDESTEVGPLAFAGQHEKVAGYIAKGTEEGAELLCGGGRPQGLDVGYFIAPAVFSNVTDEMAIAREEIFGPVTSVLSWSEDDATPVVERANGTEYGLTASVWGKDLAQAYKFARALRAGYVYVNCLGGARPLGSPFGGYKTSGLGKENCLEEVLSYTNEKAVLVDLAQEG